MAWEEKRERVKVEKGESVMSVGSRVTEPGTVQTRVVEKEEDKKEKGKAKTTRG